MNAALLLETFFAFLDGLTDRRVAAFLGGLDRHMMPRALPARPLPCIAHLRRLAVLAAPRERELAAMLRTAAPALHWGQTYTAADFGARFLENYGWVELFGTRGHFANERIAGGFLVLGPETHYPDHHHLAEEIYVPLTGGTEWRMGGGPFSRREGGEVIHHASRVSHAMRTGPEPLLALYFWRGGPLNQRSTIVGV